MLINTYYAICNSNPTNKALTTSVPALHENQVSLVFAVLLILANNTRWSGLLFDRVVDGRSILEQ